ncbi:MAG: PAS domain S-box protein, partial [Bacteroidota bacterium]
VASKEVREISADQEEVLKIVADQMQKLVEAAIEYERLKETEEKLSKTRTTLKLNERYYKSILDEAGDIIYELDQDKRLTYCNESLEKVSGYSKEEISNISIHEMVLPEYRAELLRFYKEVVVRHDSSLTYREFPILTKDGKTVWLGQKAKVRYLDEDKLKLVVVARDISDQIATNRKLVKYKNGLKLLNYISSVPNYSLSEQINLALEVGRKYLGMEKGLIGQGDSKEGQGPSFTSITYDSQSSTLPALNIIREVNSNFEKVEIFSDHTKKETPVRSAITVPYHVVDEQPGIITFCSSQEQHHALDEHDKEFVMLFSKWIGFTLEKERMIKLSSEQEILKTFANFSPAAIAILDKKLTYLALTEKWRQVKGLNGQEVIGKNHLEVQKDIKDEWKGLYGRVLAGETFKSDHDTYTDINGALRHQRWEIRPWYDNDNKVGGIIIFVDDITELKNNEIELQKAKELAEKASESKNQFLATMSHEIRTPLNAVIGISHLLMEESHSEEQQKSLKLLKDSGEHLLSLVNDILDFNKIEEGKLVFEQQEFDFKELLDGVRHSFEFQAKLKSLSFEVNYHGDIPGSVVGDKTRIRQVLVNLIANSIKFTNEGGVTLDLTTDTSAADQVKLHFELTDTGIGIADDKLKSIFNPYIQAEMHTSREYGGTGLGLTITKRLLQKMQGDIKVESQVGRGSVFRFSITLPVGQTAAGRRDHYPQNGSISTVQKVGKILLVEDNEVNKLLAERFLTRWGHEVVWAENGYKCLELIAGRDFDLILMDLQMPKMNGYETTVRIREMESSYFREIPIIALTANAFLETQSKIKAIGMNDLVVKPFNPDTFQRKLEYYLS